MKLLFSCLTVLTFLSGILVFQNCGQSFSARSSAILQATSSGSTFCVLQPNDAACTGKIDKRCSFNGSPVADGVSVTAYQNSSVSAGASCVAEKRNCVAGALSGSFAFASCAIGQPAACLFNGQSIPSGQSVTAYLMSSVAAGAVCKSEIRVCTNGILSGGNAYATCAVAEPVSCLFNGRTIGHASSVTAYAASTVPFGDTCAASVRTCYNGALSGTGDYASCTVNAAASCLFNGRTVASGESVTGYPNSTVSASQLCGGETRICQNGVLSGSAPYASCSVNSPRACTINGQTVASGAALVLYQTGTANVSGLCVAENRVCSDGTLSGTASFGSCMVPADTPVSFGVNELSLKSGESVGSDALRLSMQGDGNLVLYKNGVALWASGTVGQCTSCQAVMQGDGNFVLYNSASGSVIFDTETADPAARVAFYDLPPYVRVLNGRLSMLYTSGYALTSFALVQDQFINVGPGKSGLRFTLQSDGNLVLAEGTNPLWSTNTAGASNLPVHAVYQTDGNLVIYKSDGSVVYASATGGAYLALAQQPPFLTYSASSVNQLGTFSSVSDALQTLWRGAANFQIMTTMRIPTAAAAGAFPNSMNQGTQIIPKDGKWYLFNREYDFGPRPSACVADFSRIVVRASSDQGMSWGPQQVVATPNLDAGECALGDGHAFFDAETNRWHYLAQALTSAHSWTVDHFTRDGADPVGGFVSDSANPVIHNTQLWSAICNRTDSVCPGSTHDEGTPEISMKKDGFFFVTFHGAADSASGVIGFRGIAKTADFHSWQTTGGDLPGGAIWSSQDCNVWSVNWDPLKKCIGGGHASTIFDGNEVYMLIESADLSLGCTPGQNWVAGLVRANGFAASGNWEQWSGNPLLAIHLPNARCPIQYQRFFYDRNALYVSYWTIPEDWNLGYFNVAKLTPVAAGARSFSALKDFSHIVGFADGDGWAVRAPQSGMLIYGPYLTDLAPKAWTARFTYLADNNTDSNNAPVAVFDVRDNTDGVVLASRTVLRHDLPTAYGTIDLPINLASRANHQIEFRMNSTGLSYLKVKSVDLIP